MDPQTVYAQNTRFKFPHLKAVIFLTNFSQVHFLSCHTNDGVYCVFMLITELEAALAGSVFQESGYSVTHGALVSFKALEVPLHATCAIHGN